MHQSQLLSAIVVAGLTLSTSSMAQAASIGGPITLDTTSNVTWSAPQAGPSGLFINGVGSNQLSWGIPASRRGRSRYQFEGTTSIFDLPSTGETVEFNLGTFTHTNRPIFRTGGDFLGATLNLNLGGLNSGDDAIAINFSHLETENFAASCPAGGVPPCPDQVSLTDNDPIRFALGDWNYELTIAGFTFSDADAIPVENFLTQENKVNSARLVGRIAKVPEPTTILGTVLVLGLGIMLKRRRQQANTSL